MPGTILWIPDMAIMAAMLAVAPNVLWLARSSVLVRNTGTDATTLRIVIINETDGIVEVGKLAPGASRFLWNDPVGEATLAVGVRNGGDWQRHCGEYIEAGMYRVEVLARSPDSVACRTELPLLNRLFLADYLS